MAYRTPIKVGENAWDRYRIVRFSLSPGYLLGSGDTSGSQRNAERARAGSSEVIDTGAQKYFALGKVDLSS